MNKFWNFSNSEDNRTLYLEGAISDETWWGDEVTPAVFKAELNTLKGDITVWINSPGGDVFAASEIYTALKEYEGKITVKISALAASAASVIAMAGDEVFMSPVAFMVIHNPATIAIGDSEEMKRAIAVLDEIKSGIVNVYERKTGLSREEISHMMDIESCLNAQKAVELGFADGILYDEQAVQNSCSPILFSRSSVMNSIINKMPKKLPKPATPHDELMKRLSLIKPNQ